MPEWQQIPAATQPQAAAIGPPQAAPVRKLSLSWAPSAHARRLLTLALAGLALAVFTRRPEFAGLAAPAVLLLSTWRRNRPATLGVRIRSPRHVVEGDVVPVTVGLDGQDGFDAELQIQPGAEISAGPGASIGTRAASVPSARLRFRPERWGNRRVGTLQLMLRDPARLAEGRLAMELAHIECSPLPARLESTVQLSKLPSRLGEHRSRAAGDGVEFAGVREFVPGDRQRRINWPATTRQGSLYLSTFTAERIQNVVVIADTTVDIGEHGRTTLDLVVRGAAGVITKYLTDRDRVGLITFGIGLRWIGPGQGRRHLQRLMDLLITGPSGGERAAMTRLPRAALPPGALILVFSPLLDHRLVEAVRDLRERGFSVLVIDVLNDSPKHDGSVLSNLTGRLWQLEQDAMRFSLTQIGVPVVHWDGTTGLDQPLAQFTRRVIVVHR